MTLRSASLLTAIALAALAAPAFAQDAYDPGPPPPLPELDDWEEPYPAAVPQGRPGEWSGYAQPIDYPTQRAQWLEQCRASYTGNSGRESGQAIGAVTGAVVGGVAGNAIADDDELAGTLIGAGVGAVAGAAVGGAIGAESDRRALDECEAYLPRYEQNYYSSYRPAQAQGSYGHPQGAYGYHYPYPYPVMWVKVPIVTERRDCGCETVVEERVEVERAPPRVRRRAPDKRVRITK